MNEFEAFARVLAQESGAIIRRYFRQPMQVDRKGDASPVTAADREAEARMRELITQTFPEHGIVGEEHGVVNPEAEYTWVLDPIDGTLNFIAGGWMFGTLIALLHQGQPVLGVIHQPILQELVLGSDRGTFFNDRPVSVRSCTKLSQATLLCTDPYLAQAHQDPLGFERLRQEVQVYRGWSDCYGYVLLVQGLVDIVVDPIMHVWDIMALVPIVRGAGGRVTDYQGGDPLRGSSLVATNGAIHEAVIEVLNPRP